MKINPFTGETVMTMYRQGDFMFIRCETAPEGKTVKREGGRIIVGRGEATGHHHAVAERKVKLIETPAAERYLVAAVPFSVTHEEHAPVLLPAGMYQVRQQRTFTRGEIRRVLD